MSIVRRENDPRGTLLTDVVVPAGGIPAGSAVAIAGNEYALCGAFLTDYADSFFGFVESERSPGKIAFVITRRGTIVTPRVEGSLPLIPNEEVYLSLTPGLVTQTLNLQPGMNVIRVGVAKTSTTMVFITDARQTIGG